MTGTVIVAVVASGNVTVVSAVVNTVVPGNGVPGSVIVPKTVVTSPGSVSVAVVSNVGTTGSVSGVDAVPGTTSVSVVTVGAADARRDGDRGRGSLVVLVGEGECRADAEEHQHREPRREREVAGGPGRGDGAAAAGGGQDDGPVGVADALAGQVAQPQRRGGSGRRRPQLVVGQQRQDEAVEGRFDIGHELDGRRRRCGRRAAADQHVEQPAELAEVVGRRRVGDRAAQGGSLQQLGPGAAEDRPAGAVEHDRLAADGAVHQARGVERGDRVGDVGADQQRLPARDGDTGAEARALDVLLDHDRVELGVGAGLRPRQHRREAGMADGLIPGRELAEGARDAAGAGEPGHLDLGVGDGVHREVAGDSTDRGKRRRDPVTTREYVRLTAHDENLPRCIA